MYIASSYLDVEFVFVRIIAIWFKMNVAYRYSYGSTFGYVAYAACGYRNFENHVTVWSITCGYMYRSEIFFLYGFCLLKTAYTVI